MDRAYFDRMYTGSPDPWSFESRWYEERKRALTLATLPRRRFRSAFEPGCSIGTLTLGLAARCDRLLATDITDEPFRSARKRLAGFPGVTFEVARLPDDFPDRQFDLIVLSEVGYYLSADDLDRLARQCRAALTADGVLLACHWRHPVQDYPLGGDQVHGILRASTHLALLARHEEEDFLLDVLVPVPAESVARREHLVG